MKNILLVVFAFFMGLQLMAQEENKLDDNKVYSFVQMKAEPKEGIQGFYLDFTNEFKIDGIDAEVSEVNLRLRFVVERDGSFTDIMVVGPDPHDIGKEAIRVLKTMPNWKPAQHNGTIVRSVFTLPIKVRVNNNTAISKQELLTQEELKTFVESLNVSVVETAYFDLKCNCALIKSSMDEENTTEEFMLEARDQKAYYNIFFTKVDEKAGADILETVKRDAQNQKAVIRDIYFAGQNATEFSFFMAEEDFVSHYRMIFFYKNGYFVGTNIVTDHPQIADVLVEHLKQAFILKI